MFPRSFVLKDREVSDNWNKSYFSIRPFFLVCDDVCWGLMQYRTRLFSFLTPFSNILINGVYQRAHILCFCRVIRDIQAYT